MTDDEFWKLAAEAMHWRAMKALESQEAFERYLEENPLTPEEKDAADAAVKRLLERLHRPKDVPKCEHRWAYDIEQEATICTKCWEGSDGRKDD